MSGSYRWITGTNMQLDSIYGRPRTSNDDIPMQPLMDTRKCNNPPKIQVKYLSLFLNGYYSLLDVGFELKPEHLLIVVHDALPDAEIAMVRLSELLLNLREPTDGEITLTMNNRRGKELFKSQNTQDLDGETMRRFISWVPEEPVIFETTLRENILAACPADYSGWSQMQNLESGKNLQKQLANVMFEAGLMDFAWALPEGLDTQLDENTLEDEWKFRIGLARALLKSPLALIIEDPWSKLTPVDSKSIFLTVLDLQSAGITTILTMGSQEMLASLIEDGYLQGHQTDHVQIARFDTDQHSLLPCQTVEAWFQDYCTDIMTPND